jgi:hypothetical protein
LNSKPTASVQTPTDDKRQSSALEVRVSPP